MARVLMVSLLAALSCCGGCSVFFYALAARAQGREMAQEISGAPAYTPRGHVSFEVQPAEVHAAQPTSITLRFRVDDGFHINSHTPAGDLLVPTLFKVDAESAVKVVGEQYPAGSKFLLAVGEGETLDVYQGYFTVHLTVVAPKGETTLRGYLHYQACDKAACFPPRTLAVEVPVIAR